MTLAPIATAARRPAVRIVLAAATGAGLAGLVACATANKAPVPRYVAPSNGPTAKLVIRGSLPAGERYGVFVLDDGNTCGSPRLIGAGDESHHPASTELAADRLQTVEFRFARADQRMCVVRWSFTPAAGRSYLFNGVGREGSCRAGLIDMSDPDHLRPESTALRRNTAGEPCVPIARARGYASGGDGGDHRDAVLREGASDDDLRGLIGQ